MVIVITQSSTAHSHPGGGRVLVDLLQVVDGQQPGGGGEHHGELGRVEGGDDGDEDPPGTEQDPRHVSGGRQSGALLQESSVDEPGQLARGELVGAGEEEEIHAGHHQGGAQEDQDPHCAVYKCKKHLDYICTMYNLPTQLIKRIEDVLCLVKIR